MSVLKTTNLKKYYGANAEVKAIDGVIETLGISEKRNAHF